MSKKTRYQLAKRITLIGALVNVLLGFIKVVGGLLFHSHALVADGIHSFADLLTDGMVLLASKYGSQDADEAHPYGHQRIETAATLLLSLLLILTGMAIAWDSLYDLLQQHHTTASWLSLPTIALSIIANEGLFYYTQHIGRLIQSELILTNAWHHRSDAASSLVVLVGLIGSLMGYAFLDAIAAIAVGIMIIKMGCSYAWNSVKELIDTGVALPLVAEIEQMILDIDGVKKIHQLRTRMMGPDVFIDVHVQVAPNISVSEGHFIAQNVQFYLMKQQPQIKDVTVHIDPEDDEVYLSSMNLPNKKQLKKNLWQAWQHDYPELLSWTVHYLEGTLRIDLIAEEMLPHRTTLYERIREDLQKEPCVSSVRILIQDKIILAK